MDLIPELEAQREDHMERKVCLYLNRKKLKFGSVPEAIDFLRPLAGSEEPMATLTARQSLLGDMDLVASTFDVERASCCYGGHLLEKASRSRNCGCVVCNACGATIEPYSLRWRCAHDCDYDVCGSCRNLPRCEVTYSEATTSAGSASGGEEVEDEGLQVGEGEQVPLIQDVSREVGSNDIGERLLLQAQLAKTLRENESLREKAIRLEATQTRLARALGTGEDLRDWIAELLDQRADAALAAAPSLEHPDPAGAPPLGAELPARVVEAPTSVAPPAPEKVDAENKRETDNMPPASAPASCRGTGEEAAASAEVTHPSEEAAKDKEECGEGGEDSCGNDMSAAAPNADAALVAAPMPAGKGKGKSKGKIQAPGAPSDSPLRAVAKAAGKGKGGPPAPAGRKVGDGKGKGKGKALTAAVEPTKLSVEPSQDLKSLPWTRFMLGSQLQEGGSIWDSVGEAYKAERHADLVPAEEIEENFSKTAGLLKVDQGEKTKEKKEKRARIGSISQEARFTSEVSLRTLPVHLSCGSKAVCAIRELDGSLLSSEVAQTLHRFLCPSGQQEQEIRMTRQTCEQEFERKLEEWRRAGELEHEKPEPFLWDPVEQYMEEMAQLPACGLRLSCWGFLCQVPEKLNTLTGDIQQFEQMVQCFHSSKELPSLLSLVLAFGNYLNGGKNQKRLGQADGFHIEALGRPGGLDVVRDPEGNDVRKLIFRTFFDKCPERAERLVEELAPLFALVRRRLGKNEGVPTLSKAVCVQIEDLDRQVQLLHSEFTTKQAELKEGLVLIEDPCDRFVVQVPEFFERRREDIDDLVERKDMAMQQFKELLKKFRAETYRGDPILVDGQLKDGNPKEAMTSEVWCRIWDDFFVAKDRILSFDEKALKTSMEPRFCKGAAITVDSLEVLWKLKDAKADKAPKRRKSC